MNLNRFKFVLAESWKMIKGNKTEHLVLYFANIVGLILPLLVFAFLSTEYIKEMDKYSINYKRVAIVSMELPDFPITLQKEMMVKIPEIEIYSNRRALNYQHVFSDYGLTNVQIGMVDNNYSKFYKMRLKEGSYFTNEQLEKGERVCLIGYGAIKNLFGDVDPINKIVLINKLRYKVIGVLKNIDMTLKLFIPIKSAEKSSFTTDTDMSTIFLLRFISDVNLEKNRIRVENFFEDQGIKVYCTMVIKYIKEDLNKSMKYIIFLILIAFILTFFVIINLRNIIYLLIDTERRVFTIKYAIGVSKHDLFLEKVLIYFFVALSSLVTVLLIFLIGIYFLPGFDFTMFSTTWPFLVFPSLFLMMVLSVAEVSLLMRRIFGRNIMGLLLKLYWLLC